MLTGRFPDSKGFDARRDVNSLTLTATSATVRDCRRRRSSRLASLFLVDRDLRHRPRIRRVLAVGRGGDRIDDVEALRDLAEQRVVLRQAPGEVLVADEELAAVRVGSGVGHRERAPDVVALDRL